jgi:hypothetical protein
MADIKFEDVFLKKLITEDQDTPVADPSSDKGAWMDTLDADTDPTAFDTASNPKPELSKQNIEVAKEWVNHIDEFVNFLNGIEGNSLHAQIAKMDREGSVFRGIIKSERKKITKIAELLQSINEVVKGYIINSDRLTRELHSQGR